MEVKDQVGTLNKIMIVGEAPGAEEEREGMPFVGRAGQQLNRILTAANINREECYITNVADKRPPKNNFTFYYQDSQKKRPTDTLDRYRRELTAKLMEIKPQVVIGLGNEALQSLTGYRGIEARRSSIYLHHGTKIICTFHPSAIMRGGGRSYWYLPAAIHDLQRAKRIVEEGIGPHNPEVKIVSRADQLDQYLGSIAETTKMCAFDIETSRFGGDWIRCIGFSADEREAIVVPFENTISGLDLLKVIRKWMTLDAIGWMGQNGYNFDLPYIKKVWGFDVNCYCFDTMVAHHVLYPEFPHDLATLTSFYTLIPYYKDTAEQNLYHYNGLDAVATWIVSRRLQEELHSRGQANFYMNYYQALLTPLSHMTMQGMRIDKEYQLQLKGELKDEISTLQRKLDTTFTQYSDLSHMHRKLQRLHKLQDSGRKTRLARDAGRNKRKRLSSSIKHLERDIKKKGSLNVRSTKDLAHFLYVVLGLPKKTKQGKVTTDVTALNQLYIKTQHPFLKTMLKLRHKRNMLSRWGNIKTDEDGLIGTTYSFAETGRLKSGKFEAK